MARPRAATGHDAGLGLHAGGIQCISLGDEIGLPIATVSADTAYIGVGMSLWTTGASSVVNESAELIGNVTLVDRAALRARRSRLRQPVERDNDLPAASEIERPNEHELRPIRRHVVVAVMKPLHERLLHHPLRDDAHARRGVESRSHEPCAAHVEELRAVGRPYRITAFGDLPAPAALAERHHGHRIAAGFV